MRQRVSDLPTRLQEVNRSGTDLAVLSLKPPGAQMYSDGDQATLLARDMNNALLRIIQAHPQRFWGVGSMAPQQPEQAAQEVKRIMGALGLGGVMVNGHTNGRYLDDPSFEPILAALEEENATLYLRPRVPSTQMLEPFMRYGTRGAVWGYQAEAGTSAVRLILSGALDRHPKLNIVLGGDCVLSLALDVPKTEQVKQAIAAAQGRFGRLDISLNKAGYSLVGTVEEVREDDVRSLFDTNLLGTLRVIQAALPFLREQRSGHMVGVSSVLGLLGIPLLGLYRASKWASSCSMKPSLRRSRPSALR